MDSVSRTRRHKTRGKSKLRNKRYYKRKRQQIKRNSRRWRRLNKTRIKRYEKRRQNSPQMYKLLPAKAAAELQNQFDPTEDASLRDREIEFWDTRTDEFGFVDWLDYDEGEVHTILVDETGRRYRTYDLLTFMDVAALMYEEDEKPFLDALDNLYEDELDEGGDDEEGYDYER